MTDAKMLDRIQKMLNLAERAGTEHEATAFREKAQELMLRYAIDEAMLSKTDAKRDEQIVVRTVKVKQYAKPKINLMHQIADALGLKAMHYSGSRYGWSEGEGRVYGFESDVELFDVLFASLLIQAERDVERAWADYQRRGGETHGRKFKQSFYLSFGFRVGQRLREQRQGIIAETDASAPGTALVLFDRSKAVEKHFDNLHPNLTTMKVAHGSAEGARAGRTAGDRADLGNARLEGQRKAIH